MEFIRLSDEDTAEYDALVDASAEGTLFHKSWWFDIFRDSRGINADSVEIYGAYNNGEMVAGFPIPYRKKFGRKWIINPILTPYSGTVFKPDGIKKACTEYSFRKDVNSRFIRIIKPFGTCLYYALNLNSMDLQPFLWSDYRATLHNTIARNFAENNQFGIQGEYLQGNLITGNTLKDNSDIDLYVEQVVDTVISRNLIGDNEEASRNGGDGIGMRYGTNVTITENTVGKHYYGIKVYYSNKTTVSSNTVADSGVNIRFDFGTTDSVIKFNNVSNGVDNILIAGDSSGIMVEYNLVSNGKDSIYLFNSGDNTVQHNNVYDSTYGIRLYKSTGNVITLNYLHDNENDVYPDGSGSTVSDNAKRSNYYGKETASITPTPWPGSGMIITPTPVKDEGQVDLITWILNFISSLFS